MILLPCFLLEKDSFSVICGTAQRSAREENGFAEGSMAGPCGRSSVWKEDIGDVRKAVVFW